MESWGQEQVVIDIALCFNDAYEKHIGPLLFSLVKHNTQAFFRVHIVYRNLSTELQDRLKGLEQILPGLELIFHYLDSEHLHQIGFAHDQFPIETYFRLFLAEVLPDCDRLLYFDVDLLVCGDVVELWSFDMQGAPIAAVVERDIYEYFGWYLEKLGFDEKNHYFTAGVLLLDTKQIRERNLTRDLVQMAVERGSEFKFCDQDLLNIYFKDEVVFFDKRYNYTQYWMYHEALDKEELRIIHYSGAPLKKPWNNVATFPEQLRKYVWYYQQNRSEFRNLYYVDQEKISILVASHNNEQFIEMALGSLVNQTYHQLEILVLDDGSTDNSYQRALDFAKFDRRIQVFQQENQGVSQTRRGLAMMATGSYSFYLDGDDWLEEGAIQALYSVLIENQSDIVIGQHYIYNQDAGKYITYTANDGMVEKISAIEAIQRQHDYNYVSFWGNLYATNLLQELEFCDAGLSDGLAMMYKLYLRANSIVYYRSTIYAHRKRSHQLYAYSDTELVDLFATTIKIYSEYLIKLLFLEIKNPTIEAEFRRKVLEMKEVLENRQLLTNTVYKWIQEKLGS